MHPLFSKGLYNRQNLIEGMNVPKKVTVICPFYSLRPEETLVETTDEEQNVFYRKPIYENCYIADGFQHNIVKNMYHFLKNLIMIGVSEIDIVSNEFGRIMLDKKYTSETHVLAKLGFLRPNLKIAVLNKEMAESSSDDKGFIIGMDAISAPNQLETLRANKNFLREVDTFSGLFETCDLFTSISGGVVIKPVKGRVVEALKSFYYEYDGSTGATESLILRCAESEVSSFISTKIKENEVDNITTTSFVGWNNYGVNFTSDSSLTDKPPVMNSRFTVNNSKKFVEEQPSSRYSFDLQISRTDGCHGIITRDLNNYLSFDVHNLLTLTGLLTCHLMVYREKFPLPLKEDGTASHSIYNASEFLKGVKDKIFGRMFSEDELITTKKRGLEGEKLDNLKINADLVAKFSKRSYDQYDFSNYSATQDLYSMVNRSCIEYAESTKNYSIIHYDSHNSIFRAHTLYPNVSYMMSDEYHTNLDITLIGLGGIGWNVSMHCDALNLETPQVVSRVVSAVDSSKVRSTNAYIGSPNIRYVYEYDELEVHNGSRLPVDIKTLSSGQTKVRAYRESNRFYASYRKCCNFNHSGNRVDESEVSDVFNRREPESLISCGRKYIVDCRDNIISEHIIPHTIFKASYDGGEYFSFFTLPKATAHMSFDVNPEATAYQVIPSYYVTPAIISVCAVHLLSYDNIRDLVERVMEYQYENRDTDKYISDFKKYSIDQEFCITDLLRQCSYQF